MVNVCVLCDGVEESYFQFGINNIQNVNWLIGWRFPHHELNISLSATSPLCNGSPTIAGQSIVPAGCSQSRQSPKADGVQTKLTKWEQFLGNRNSWGSLDLPSFIPIYVQTDERHSLPVLVAMIMMERRKLIMASTGWLMLKRISPSSITIHTGRCQAMQNHYSHCYYPPNCAVRGWLIKILIINSSRKAHSSPK